MRNDSQAGPDYDVEISADALLADLASDAAAYGRDYVEKREWWQESLEAGDEWPNARYWMREAEGGRNAYSEVIAALQPEHHATLADSYRNADDTVAVRGLMRWLSEEAQRAHDRSGTPLSRNPRANEAETAYTAVISILRDDYDIGWPRLDDVGGNPLECDLP